LHTDQFRDTLNKSYSNTEDDELLKIKNSQPTFDIGKNKRQSNQITGYPWWFH